MNETVIFHCADKGVTTTVTSLQDGRTFPDLEESTTFFV